MNVCFRPAAKADLEQLSAIGVVLPARLAEPDRYGMGTRGFVVTVDGCVVLVCGRQGDVLYQSGGDAIPDLLRAQRRIWRAIPYLDRDWIRRKGKPRLTIADVLAGRA